MGNDNSNNQNNNRDSSDNLGSESIDISQDNQSGVNTSQQYKSSRPWLKKFQFKKGQSGNPSGKRTGKSMKEYAREYLSKMSDDERIEFMNAIDEDVVWRMGEGNPRQDTDITSGGEPIQPLFDYVANRTNNLNKQDTKPDEKN